MIGFCITLLTLTASSGLVMGFTFKQTMGLLALQAAMMFLVRLGYSHNGVDRVGFYAGVVILFITLSLIA